MFAHLLRASNARYAIGAAPCAAIIPRVELHLLAVPARDHAEAVVLDLVQPLRLARRLQGRRGRPPP
jgi:hypothetical protein